MSINRVMLILFTVLLAALISACSTAAGEATTRQVELVFTTHLATGMPEQDVFIEVHPGSDQVRRLTLEDGEAYEFAPVYAAGSIPVENARLGPFVKGHQLSFTMGEWLAGEGSGAYTVVGDEAYIDATFDRLVPYGVYTLWCAHRYVPPEFKIEDEPCGKKDGSENVFVTDAYGRAEVHLKVGALPNSVQESVHIVAAVYHSDSQVEESYPGVFGQNRHVQVLAFIPTQGNEDWQVYAGGHPLVQR